MSQRVLPMPSPYLRRQCGRQGVRGGTRWGRSETADDHHRAARRAQEGGTVPAAPAPQEPGRRAQRQLGVRADAALAGGTRPRGAHGGAGPADGARRRGCAKVPALRAQVRERAEPPSVQPGGAHRVDLLPDPFALAADQADALSAVLPCARGQLSSKQAALGASAGVARIGGGEERQPQQRNARRAVRGHLARHVPRQRAGARGAVHRASGEVPLGARAQHPLPRLGEHGPLGRPPGDARSRAESPGQDCGLHPGPRHQHPSARVGPDVCDVRPVQRARPHGGAAALPHHCQRLHARRAGAEDGCSGGAICVGPALVRGRDD
mmetsp:Transcript_28079/g.53477  ORF Transcript_28079/g.53477 Transcript_28079/m.53477 type:complete len:323 (+) Transcript_28079:489-1457(+)